jgi:hypothetical protein
MMSDPPKTDDPQEPEVLGGAEAEALFNETLGRLAATPPKPHKDEPKRPRGKAK